MTQHNDPGDQIITLESGEGQSYSCRVCAVFEFKNKEYALLENLGVIGAEPEDSDEPAMVIMELQQQDDQATFRVIENDQEFDEVRAFVSELAKEMAEDDEAEDDDGDEEN